MSSAHAIESMLLEFVTAFNPALVIWLRRQRRSGLFLFCGPSLQFFGVVMLAITLALMLLVLVASLNNALLTWLHGRRRRRGLQLFSPPLQFFVVMILAVPLALMLLELATTFNPAHFVALLATAHRRVNSGNARIVGVGIVARDRTIGKVIDAHTVAIVLLVSGAAINPALVRRLRRNGRRRRERRKPAAVLLYTERAIPFSLWNIGKWGIEALGMICSIAGVAHEQIAAVVAHPT